MKEFAELIRIMLLAQRATRRTKTGITDCKRIEREVEHIVKEVLEIEKLTDEPK